MSKLDLNNIQGDILLDGLPKRVESFFFFQIADGHVKDFCLSLKQVAKEIAHVDNTAQMRQDINDGKAARKEGGLVEMAGANIAFSWKGLQKFSIPISHRTQSIQLTIGSDGYCPRQRHRKPFGQQF